MTNKITLILDFLPTDLNRYINAFNRNRFLANNIKQTETTAVSAKCKEQEIKPIDYKVRIDFYWYVKNKKKDPDNVSFSKKFILDGVVKAGVLENDGMKQIEGFTDHFIVDNCEQVIIDFVKV